ncbi:hypothetical protein HNO88_000486 [Novosphingobium chloroacetimidivorans]|uniref:Uncharacterized protein n=1 Tax=Novosphingobium chloroacetimidivorans TaxID=1428314 RepID=A0A7W7NVD4_9SPHN|nr:hypothetical protein [Novosphingobium chloroacetimidivorans]MBB4857179.1 hypothetical protein [Novosphingobium chloroacetimidivorans]
MTFQRFNASAADRTEQPQEPPPSLPRALDQRLADAQSAIDALECQAQPHGLSEARWYELLKDLRHVSDQWLDLGLGCGWSLLDLFGCPPTLSGRVGLMGVVVLLRGRSIESIDQDRIVIANRLGPPNVFYRQSPGVSVPFDRSGARLVWDILNQGEKE